MPVRRNTIVLTYTQNALTPSSTRAGVSGENLATFLQFDIPAEMEGLNTKLQVSTADGSFDESAYATAGRIEMPLRAGVLLPGWIRVTVRASDDTGVRISADCALWVHAGPARTNAVAAAFPQDFEQLQDKCAQVLTQQPYWDAAQTALGELKKVLSRTIVHYTGTWGNGKDDAGVQQLSVADGTRADLAFSGATYTQMLQNGNFANGAAGWTNTSGVSASTVITDSTFGHALKIVPSITPTSAGVAYADIAYPAGNHRYYVSAYVRSGVSRPIAVILQATPNLQQTATVGSAWVHFSFVADTAAATNLTGLFTVCKADSNVSSAAFYLANPMLIDMGADASDPLYNLSADQLADRFTAYFEGSQSIVNPVVTCRKADGSVGSTLGIPGVFAAGDAFVRANGVSYKNGQPLSTNGECIAYAGGQTQFSCDTGIVPSVSVTCLADVIGLLPQN